MTAEQQTAFKKLIVHACTCRTRNSPGYMQALADAINDAIAAQGGTDRVRWPGRWATGFELEIDGANLEVIP